MEDRQICLNVNSNFSNRQFHVEQDGFARRVWEAYKDLEKREGRVSQSELARRIEARGGHPTRQDDVSRWFREVSRPSFEELPAIAEVLGVDLMWLAFGTIEAGDETPRKPAAKRESRVLDPHEGAKPAKRRKA